MHKDFSRIARLLYEKNWSEGFGGNFSVRFTSEAKQFLEHCCKNKLIPANIPIDMDVNPLNNNVILITVSGSRMYEIPENPTEYTAVIFIENNTVFSMNGKKPSSELIAHLSAYIANDNINAIIHTHPPYTIAIAETMESEGKINRALKESHTEFSLIFPKGIAVIERKKPGSRELAEETSKRMSDTPFVIWKRHGIIAGAENLFHAFDLTDVVEKCARISMISL